MKITDWVAIYAAIVSSGTFVWQVFTWFRAGARLSLSIMPQALMFGGKRDDERLYFVVNVTNRGDRLTTITHFSLLPARRQKHLTSQIVLRPELPGHPPSLPHALEAGKTWMGVCLPEPDLRKQIDEGRYIVAIYATHREKPTTAKIKKHVPGA